MIGWAIVVVVLYVAVVAALATVADDDGDDVASYDDDDDYCYSLNCYYCCYSLTLCCYGVALKHLPFLNHWTSPNVAYPNCHCREKEREKERIRKQISKLYTGYLLDMYIGYFN